MVYICCSFISNELMSIKILNSFAIKSFILRRECILKYYLKTGACKFGATCKYYHPRDKNRLGGQVEMNYLGLPMCQVCYLNFGR